MAAYRAAGEAWTCCPWSEAGQDEDALTAAIVALQAWSAPYVGGLDPREIPAIVPDLLGALEDARETVREWDEAEAKRKATAKA